MSSVLLEIPDDLQKRPAWLDRQLAGTQLPELVAELSAVHSDELPQMRSLADILGSASQAVLDQGLSALPPDRLHDLLRHPEQLMILQERILVDGGPYWRELLTRSPELTEITCRGWTQLQSAIENEAPASEGPPVIPFDAAQSRTRRAFLIPASIAAALATGFFIGFGTFRWQANQQPVAAKGWGWNSPVVFTAKLPADEYLRSVADSASEWFNRRPEQRAELAARVLQFREGCTRLILAKHEPLLPEDRAWLLERCRVWSKAFDGHLADLENGTPIATVREQADQTVNKLITALRSRADQVGGAS